LHTTYSWCRVIAPWFWGHERGKKCLRVATL
jgi:hypothetical protein